LPLKPFGQFGNGFLAVRQHVESPALALLAPALALSVTGLIDGNSNVFPSPLAPRQVEVAEKLDPARPLRHVQLFTALADLCYPLLSGLATWALLHDRHGFPPVLPLAGKDR